MAECGIEVVVGAPDETWGEVGHLFWVADSRAALDADAIAALLRERLAGYKVPKRFTLMDSLPRNAAGKLLKSELRARASPPAEERDRV